MDRLVYKDALDYEALFREVGTELLTSNRTQDVATAVADRLVEALHLESALVFLGEEPARTALAAGVGGRSAEIRRHWNPEIATYTEDGVDRQLLDIRVGPDSLLLATMTLSDRYLGYLLLGPKERGEVFVEEEKRLVANLTRGDGAGQDSERPSRRTSSNCDAFRGDGWSTNPRPTRAGPATGVGDSRDLCPPSPFDPG